MRPPLQAQRRRCAPKCRTFRVSSLQHVELGLPEIEAQCQDMAVDDADDSAMGDAPSPERMAL